MKKLLTVIIVFGCFFMAAFAGAAEYADNFDDGIMDANLWVYVNGDKPVTNLYESGGLLNFISEGSSGKHNDKVYASTWQYGMNSNFSARADFDFNSTALNGNGAILLGAYMYSGTSSPLSGGEPDLMAQISVASDSNPAPGNSANSFRMDILRSPSDVTPPIWTSRVDRSITSGSLHIDYNATTDLMQFAVLNQSGATVVSDTYSNFRNLGTSPMGVYLGGFTDYNYVITPGQASLDNFTSQGTVAPEPVSSALFLIGGAVLALKRYRKKAVTA